MPSLIDLRRRIRAVKSTQQITKAMKMIAASRLKRAQDRVVAARPFSQRMQAVLQGLVSRVDQTTHPLLRVPESDVDRPLVIIVTADRGLCGSFNTNVIKAAAVYVTDSTEACSLGLVGRKGKDFFGRRGYDVLFDQTGIFQKLRFEDAQIVAQLAVDAFTSGQVDRVMLVYNEFKSVISQKVVMEQLLPMAPVKTLGGSDVSAIPAIINLFFTLPAGRWFEKKDFSRDVFWTAVFSRCFYLLWIFLPWFDEHFARNAR